MCLCLSWSCEVRRADRVVNNQRVITWFGGELADVLWNLLFHQPYPLCVLVFEVSVVLMTDLFADSNMDERGAFKPESR
jgi:hypothetical protein